MQKRYRVVVGFGSHEAGDIIEGDNNPDGTPWIEAETTRGKGCYLPLEFVSDKLEEVKPKALRKWLVEEVATREEATTRLEGLKHCLNTEKFNVFHQRSDIVGGLAWVKITEQKEEKRWVPKLGEAYWSTSDGLDDCNSVPVEMKWDDDNCDWRWLEAGDVFKTWGLCQAYIDSKKKAA